MKFKFTVGAQKEHLVEFRWNQFWGSLLIRVDGIVVKRRLIQLQSRTRPIPKNAKPSDKKWNVLGMEIDLTEEWKFTVGDNNQYEVVIEKRRENLWLPLGNNIIVYWSTVRRY